VAVLALHKTLHSSPESLAKVYQIRAFSHRLDALRKFGSEFSLAGIETWRTLTDVGLKIAEGCELALIHSLAACSEIGVASPRSPPCPISKAAASQPT
jgi:hypothetical protein